MESDVNSAGKSKSNNVIEQLCAQAFYGRCVILDGSNISHRGSQKPRLIPIEAMQQRVRSYGAKEVITFVDPTLIHQVPEEDGARINLLLKQGELHQSPKGTKADNFILPYAAERSAVVITNDCFEDFPELRIHVQLLRFMILPGNNTDSLYSILFNLDDLKSIIKKSSPSPSNTNKISTNLPYFRELFTACKRIQDEKGVILMSSLKPALVKLAPQLSNLIKGKGMFKAFLEPFERQGIIKLLSMDLGRTEIQWNYVLDDGGEEADSREDV